MNVTFYFAVMVVVVGRVVPKLSSGWMELVQFDTGMIPARHDTLACLSR